MMAPLRFVPAPPTSATPPPGSPSHPHPHSHLSQQLQAGHHLPCPPPSPPLGRACRSLRPPSPVSTSAPTAPARCWWTVRRPAWASKRCTRRSSWERPDTKPDPGCLVTVRGVVGGAGWTQRQMPIPVNAEADSSLRHLQRQLRPSVASHLYAYSHICIFTDTGCAEVHPGEKCGWMRACTHPQLTCTATLPACRMMIATSDLCWHRSHHGALGLHKVVGCAHFWQFCTTLQQVGENLLQGCTNLRHVCWFTASLQQYAVGLLSEILLQHKLRGSLHKAVWLHLL